MTTRDRLMTSSGLMLLRMAVLVALEGKEAQEALKISSTCLMEVQAEEANVKEFRKLLLLI